MDTKNSSNIKPSIIGNFIFTISTDGYFFIIEKNTGNILRITNVFNNLKKKKNKEFYPTGFVFNFQNLFISTNNGKLIVTDIKTGKIKNIFGHNHLEIQANPQKLYKKPMGEKKDYSETFCFNCQFGLSRLLRLYGI